MAAEHLRIMDDGRIGLYQGYFCGSCGQGGLNMYGMGRDHNPMAKDWKGCPRNPTLVSELQQINKFGEEVVGLHYSELIDLNPLTGKPFQR